MRAKEIWALVPVPSHVVKKVVSACCLACPVRHVDSLSITRRLWHSGANNLGLSSKKDFALRNASAKDVNPFHYCHQSFARSLLLPSASILTMLS